MQGAPVSWLAARSLVLCVVLGCAGEDSKSVTYAGDIFPMLHDCADCHRPGAPFAQIDQGPDVVDAYSPPNGLVEALNYWKQADPTLPIPVQVVAPGQPDESFLITKIDRTLGPFPEHAGDPMPVQSPALTMEELEIVEQWVRNGAQPAEYEARVAPLFVIPVPGKIFARCSVCHFKGTPNPPDLTDPFGPDGIVGVRSTFRSDLMRVAPGDPDASLLVLRLRASTRGDPPSSEIGAPMPKPVLPLSETQVALVRQWISEGAQP